jgi:hypothetical protein
VPVAVDRNGEKLSKSRGSAALTASAMPALLAAWRFLGQALPAEPFASAEHFWTWAFAHWQPQRIARSRFALAPTPFDAHARV